MASSPVIASPASPPAVVGASYHVAYDATNPKVPTPATVNNYDANPTVTFAPLKIRELTLKNRAVVSPMCQYSAEDGFANDHHLRHYSTFGMGGAGLVFIESTGVTANGRITPQCLGIWKDEHVAPLKRIVDFLHVHNVPIGLQISHSGRKGSTYAPFQGVGYGGAVDAKDGGWSNEVVGPSAVKFNDIYPPVREITVDEIKDVQHAFVAAAKRADAAGFDVLELHGANGYLISSFLSPIANKRTDNYGGSLENRMRFLLETVEAVRAVWPSHKPLSVRITTDDFVTGGWTIDESLILATKFKPLGVDIIDCQAGGNVDFHSPLSTLKPFTVGYLVPLAERIKKHVPDMNVIAVGNIQTGTQAEGYIKAGSADLIAVGRGWLANPFLAQSWAKELGVDLAYPPQYNYALKWGAPAKK